MARTPNKTEVKDLNDESIDQPKVAGAMALMRDDAVKAELALNAQSAKVTELAKQLNYSGSTDPAVLENSALDAIRRIGMGIFELGAYLLLLRESSTHGNFLPALERIGIEAHAAQRYMRVTRQFANTTTSSHLEKAGMNKLVELAVLDSEQIEELTELGQTGELALDDLTRMSVKELRAAVRKERQEAAKQKSRAERQESINAELHEEVKMISRLKPEEATKRTQAEASDIQADTVGLIKGALRQALIALNNCESDQQLFMAGMVGQVMAELVMLRDEFSLPEVGGKPEWERWAEAQDTATAPAKAN